MNREGVGHTLNGAAAGVPSPLSQARTVTAEAGL